MIEVLVALLLTAVATTGLLGMYSVQTRASVRSRHEIEASELAQDQLERLRTLIAPEAVVRATQERLDETGRVTPTGVFSRSWTITPSPAHCDLVVTVSWNEDGIPRQVVMRGKRSR